MSCFRYESFIKNTDFFTRKIPRQLKIISANILGQHLIVNLFAQCEENIIYHHLIMYPGLHNVIEVYLC